jgi:hypothetical protein
VIDRAATRGRERIACGGLSLVLCAGCSLSLDLPRLDLPAGTEAVILVTVPDRGAPTAIALSTAAARASHGYLSFVPTSSSAHVLALAYHCTLEALGIASTSFALSQGGSGYPLPTPDTALSARIEGGRLVAPFSAGSTTAAFGLRAAENAFLSPPTLCQRFEVTSHVAADTVGAPHVHLELAEPIDAHTALVVARDGYFYRAHDDGSFARIRVATGTPDLAAYLSDTREIWLVGPGGAVAHGPIDTLHLSMTASTSSVGYNYALDGPTRGASCFELFSASDAGPFARFDGMHWKVLDPGAGDINNRDVGVAWIRCGEAIAVGTRAGGLVVHYRDGVTAVETLPLDISLDRAVTARHVDPFGALIGTAFGSVLAFDSNGARILVSSIQGRIRVLTPSPGGFLFDGSQGVLHQYANGSVCSDAAAVGPSDFELVVPVGSSYIAAFEDTMPEVLIGALRASRQAAGGCQVPP